MLLIFDLDHKSFITGVLQTSLMYTQQWQRR